MLPALLLAAALAAAAPVAAASLTERQFLDRVLADPRVLVLLDEPLAAARAERARTAALANPEASFERESFGGSLRQDTWSVSWAAPLDGRTWAERRAGRAAVEAAGHRHALSRVELRARLREAFAGWALAAESARVGRALADRVERLARAAEAKAGAGEASALSARRLLLARAEIGAEAARLEAELARAAAEVRAWMPDAGAEVIPARPALPPPADSALWRMSPELSALDADVRRAEAGAAAAGWFLGGPVLRAGRLATPDAAADDGTLVGVSWSVPLFDRRQGDRLESRASLAAAHARRDLARDRVRERFAAASQAYAIHRAEAERARPAEPAAERVFAAATALYEAGESDMTDLLESLRGALAGHLASLGSHAAALRAHRELELAAGRPLTPTEGGE